MNYKLNMSILTKTMIKCLVWMFSDKRGHLSFMPHFLAFNKCLLWHSLCNVKAKQKKCYGSSFSIFYNNLFLYLLHNLPNFGWVLLSNYNQLSHNFLRLRQPGTSTGEHMVTCAPPEPGWGHLWREEGGGGDGAVASHPPAESSQHL